MWEPRQQQQVVLGRRSFMATCRSSFYDQRIKSYGFLKILKRWNCCLEAGRALLRSIFEIYGVDFIKIACLRLTPGWRTWSEERLRAACRALISRPPSPAVPDADVAQPYSWSVACLSSLGMDVYLRTWQSGVLKPSTGSPLALRWNSH